MDWFSVHSGPPRKPPRLLPPCPRKPFCSHCNRVSHDTSPPFIPASVDEGCPRRLINVHTLELVHFQKDDPVPHYAILSHSSAFEWKSVAGYIVGKKERHMQILFACNQARGSGLDYLWDDTRCITRYDYNDLLQNIMHMFSYYRNASVCYVVLQSLQLEYWFRTGWALQELLAPPEIFFFAGESFVGSRTERAKEISDRTGISEDVVSGRISVYDVSVRERMSWASKRFTFQKLDRIYCLLGILGVSMQPDYNEDLQMAVARLREAFYQQHPDQFNSFNNGLVDIFCLLSCSRHRSRIPGVPILPSVPPQSRPILLSCLGDEALHSNENCPRRLINTRTFELVDFEANISIPHYAILSHRWLEGEEVDLREFKHPTEGTRRKLGYQKIVAACKEACLDGLHYLWVDTCCIDQKDPGDVHRNIKLMFAYYQNARICYAYLVDVDKGNNNFEKSVWFTRGWTLQELLAPPEVLFFSRSWEYLGTRTGQAEKIHGATGIPEGVIKGTTPIHDIDVEERMIWSTPRTTSRPQDLAYCLFGILEVSIQPDYKEEVDRAFTRLQEACYEKYPHLAKRFYVHSGGLFSTLLARFRERSVYRRVVEEERSALETERHTLEKERRAVEEERRALKATLEEERHAVEKEGRALKAELHALKQKRRAVEEESRALGEASSGLGGVSK